MEDISNIGALKIGTSGIVVPGTKNSFPKEYQERSRLCFYSSLFNTLEINSSFYKVPQPGTFQRWANEVPEDFKFTVKLLRDITHAKKLIYQESDIERFMHAANTLGNKKGCLLIQFPASITVEYITVVERIIASVAAFNSDRQWKLAIEFRDKSWYQEPLYNMLEKYDASMVLHDMAKSKPPIALRRSPVVYFRFHGPAGDYKGDYSDEFLEGTAVLIRDFIQQGKDVYAYFNNTMGAAFQNAQQLKGLISR